MRKKLLCAALALCLAISLAACGEEPKEMSPEEAFEELLAGDYEIYYLLYAGGLTTDSGQSKMLENTQYWLVNSPDYSTMETLQRRLEKVYFRGETVKSILGATDADGQPLLRSQDGHLWRSASSPLLAQVYEVEEDTVRKENWTDTTATFVFQETALDGSLYETRLSMTKTAVGWRLDNPRWEAERILLRDGSDKDSLVSSGAARRAAEEFLSSILDGGIPEVRGVTLGKVSAWENIRIRSAVLTKAVEEMDSQGTYIVRVDVEAGGGVFPEGEQDYRLEMRCDEMRFGDKVYPAYFRPATEQYYNRMGYVERLQIGLDSAEKVKTFIDYFGTVIFQTPWELPPETVVEFSLFYARSAEGNQRFTQAELDDAIRQTFGITGFDGRETEFYLPDQNRYLLWGRDSSIRDYLIGMPRIRGNQAQVEVIFYGDVLCTSPSRIIYYTLEKEGDSWRLLSALPTEGDGEK